MFQIRPVTSLFFLVFATLSTTPAFSQRDRLPSIGEVRKELLSRHDANEDGWLDAQERESLRKEAFARSSAPFPRRRGRRGGRDGRQAGQERQRQENIPAAASREQWQAVVNAFDANKNGYLEGVEIDQLYKDLDAGKVGDLPKSYLRSTLARDSKMQRSGRQNLEDFDLDYDDRLNSQELKAFRKSRLTQELPPNRPEKEREGGEEEGKAEAEPQELERAPRVVFSHPHGFQEASFEL
ncbi:MAG TPA: hypothetical protein DD471_12255, partial [Planctomycetes bacterium]|nr:hypothetical protein [Planctomycetota bacterium]